MKGAANAAPFFSAKRHSARQFPQFPAKPTNDVEPVNSMPTNMGNPRTDLGSRIVLRRSYSTIENSPAATRANITDNDLAFLSDAKYT